MRKTFMPPYLPAKDWENQKVFILGGGMSMATLGPHFTPEGRIGRSLHRIIAVNNSWEYATKADVLYFSDKRWYDWNKNRLGAFEGNLILTRAYLTARDAGPALDRIHWIARRYGEPISHDGRFLAGWCGGANAMNLAFLRGATTIVLVGFDGGEGNYHTKHRVKTPAGHFDRHIYPSMLEMIQALTGAGIEVINATPNSVYSCIPYMPIEEL